MPPLLGELRLLTPLFSPTKEALSVKPVSRGIDRIAVTFDETNLVANAGLLLVATVVKKIGLEALVNTPWAPLQTGRLPARSQSTHLGARHGGRGQPHRPRRRAAGRGHDQVLPHRVMAPSTLGTFLRGFTFGHLRQFDAVAARPCVGPGRSGLPERLVVDLDSTICEVAGKLKAGAASATPRSSAITRCSPHEPTPARCSTPACARARPIPSAGPSASSKS